MRAMLYLQHMKNDTGSLEAKMDSVLEAVISLGAQVEEFRVEMRTNYATKADLSDLEERLTGEIRTISKAVDKDAVTIVDHEKRITRIEERIPAAV